MDGGVGDSNIIHVSKSRPFWNKYFILSKYGMVTIHIGKGKDDLWRRHIYVQSMKRPQFPQVFCSTIEEKA